MSRLSQTVRQQGSLVTLTPRAALTTEAARLTARERFERRFGAVDLGRATGADNASIDADLAKEYADDHGLR